MRLISFPKETGLAGGSHAWGQCSRTRWHRSAGRWSNLAGRAQGSWSSR